MATGQSIINDINAYMQKCGGKASDWYVGIAADARARLFNDHCVNEKTDAWIYRQADTSTMARSVEDAYHKSGHDGGPGGGDNSTVFVYAYRKGSHTDP